jgi:predicted phosphoribosyltransferase
MRAAIAAMKRAGAARVLVAAPTAQWETLARLNADAIVCPNVRSGFPFAVANAYARWSDVDEEDALALVRELSAPPG